MPNQEIAKIFRNMAFYLEMEEIAFKPQVYEKAAENLETLSESIGEIYKKGGVGLLEKIPGIGKSMVAHIVEYLKTGKIKEYEQLKKKMPINLDELSGVEGLGPKKISILYKVLGIKNLKELENAAKKHKIAPLSGFGEKTEKNILEGVEFLKRSSGRFLLGYILPEVRKIMAKLANLKEVEFISEAGSLRRRKETIGDADILAISSKPQAVINRFVSLPGVIKILSKGTTKASIRLKEGLDVDLRVLKKESFGSALQYFTGSKEHNIVLRKIAIEKGLKLSEYGLFKKIKNQKSKIKITNQIGGQTEEEIYHLLGMDYIPPEMRENSGEIEAAIKGELPHLIELKDIKGDLHCHSHWGDGIGPQMIEQYIFEAKKRGYEYIGISDHTKFLFIERGLNEKQLMEQNKEIKSLNSKFYILNSKFRILHGCEANIMADGSIDINNETLSKLDYVIAGVHSQFKMSKKEMTERIIKAMRNPNVDIISHPTGRILKKREEYEIDFDEILKVAKETGTILEINASPYRLDLNGANVRKAKEAGVKMIINTDSHQKEQMDFMEYGVSQARRGWAEKEDIINAQYFKNLVKFFK
ncbi:MAG: DNA polymerase/3'-5' exonuclease PolX [Patescibacteria group bacterium]